LILFNVPLALVGGISALWLPGINLNFSASIGFIALFGVAVLNGIVIVSHINLLRFSDRSGGTYRCRRWTAYGHDDRLG